MNDKKEPNAYARLQERPTTAYSCCLSAPSTKVYFAASISYPRGALQHVTVIQIKILLL